MRISLVTLGIWAALTTQPSPVKSPDVAADHRVTFRLRAAEARTVTVTGIGDPLDMRRDSQGLWSATSSPLQPDIYAYQFLVDGHAQNDPSNPDVVSVFGKTGPSRLAVPGALWSSSVTAPGKITRHNYESAATGGTQVYYVYTPPGYDPGSATRYPVFYLLHGVDSDAYSWVSNGGANTTLDNLIAQGKAVPMLLVMPLGFGSPDGLGRLDRFVRSLADEIIPQVERTYRVSTERTGRAIAGLSMGAGQSVAIAFADLDRFAWVGGFSGQYGIVEQYTGRSLEASFDRVDARSAASLRLVYLTCGSDDVLLGWTSRLNEVLTAKNVRTIYREYPQAGHVWSLWRQNFADMAQLVFR